MNNPRLVLLLPITRHNLTSRYIDGLEEVISSPISMRVLIINKTQNDLDGLVSRFRNRVDNLDCSILFKHKDTGIFEGFMNLSIQENEWIMQIHDDDWVKGEIKTFNPKSRYCYYVPHGLKNEKSFFKSINANEWVFSAISSFFWNTLISYFDFIGQAPLPSSDYTLNILIKALGIREQLNDYSYHYSFANWSPRSRQGHLRNILIQNGWGDFANSRIATLNMKIDALAISIFALLHNQSQEVNSKLLESLELQEMEIMKSISRFRDAGIKSKLSQIARINEKSSQSEWDYFTCFIDVNSIRDLPGAISKLERLDIPALAKRAKKWSELIKGVGA